jgi:hypothetical protein
MRLLYNNRFKIIISILIIIGFMFIIYSYKSDKLMANNSLISNDSALITALSSYYGEWEVVEDFGYHGIHRVTELEEFEIGKTIFFGDDGFQYADSIDVSFPNIVIEITSSANMQQLDGMEYPHQMGFHDQYAQYAKIKIYDHSINLVCNFYILNDNEIIIEGDVHRYYRAVKKN